MSSRKREAISIETKIIIIAFLFLCLGYFMLNHIATWEEPPLGNTFHIVGGCILIAASALVIIMAVRTKYFPKKKKKKSRPIFLDELPKKQQS